MSTWTYRADAGREASKIIGYDVEATDGSIGDVTDESIDVDRSHIVVDTGFWLLEKKRLIPAGAVTRVDHENEKIYLSMSKDAVKDAPDFVEESRVHDDPNDRDRLARYYQPWIAL